MNQLIYWLPVACALLHVFEEFVWPGGFATWFRVYRPETTSSFTAAYAVVVNGLMLAIGMSLGVFGPHWSRGPSLWLIFMAVLGYNALFHLVGTIRLRRYSPGLVTGLLLYLPLCTYGYGYLYLTRQATLGTLAGSALLATFFQVWSYTNHKQRAARLAMR